MNEYGFPRSGFCAWCREMCPDVTEVRFIERGSGPGASVYGCLDHARPRVGAWDAPASLPDAITAMEKRATETGTR